MVRSRGLGGLRRSSASFRTGRSFRVLGPFLDIIEVSRGSNETILELGVYSVIELGGLWGSFLPLDHERHRETSSRWNPPFPPPIGDQDHLQKTLQFVLNFRMLIPGTDERALFLFSTTNGNTNPQSRSNFSQAPKKAAKAAVVENVQLGPQVKEGENVFGVCHIFASFNDTFVVSRRGAFWFSPMVGTRDGSEVGSGGDGDGSLKEWIWECLDVTIAD